MKKTQVAMEYVMILSLVLMMLIPTVYLFREYTLESGDEVTVNKVNSIARNIIDNTREIFYLGAPSTIVIDIEMPKQIEKMWLMNNQDINPEIKQEYYLMFKLNLKNGPEDFYFFSEIPLLCSSEYCTNDPESDPIELNEQCEKEIILETKKTKFHCYRFPERAYSPGIKHFKIEAADDCPGICILLKEISND